MSIYISMHLLSIIEKWHRQHVLNKGEPMIGWIVQANPALDEPLPSGGAPAQVLISFPRHFNGAAFEELEEIANRLGRLKFRTSGLTKVERKAARLVNDEGYQPGIRLQLPLEFTNGLVVYSVHVWIERSLLPERCLTRPYIQCRGRVGSWGWVYMVPYSDDPNGRLWPE